nr:hypothetical protein [Candidatus Sigynarchaeota archaeon]
MQIQLDSLSREIKNFAEVLSFNGLNLVSQENIRQIEMFLQQASQLQAFRLATSLRYLHVEMDRFITHHPAFNIERYVFFLNNCWLFSNAFLAKSTQGTPKQIAHASELMGKPSEPVDIPGMKLRLIGIEKVYLEGAMFGIIFHFLSTNGELKQNIVKLSLLQQPKGVVNPEVLLGMNIPNNDPPIPFFLLLKKDVVVKNIKLLEKEATIQLAQAPPSIFSLSNLATSDVDPFPIEIFDQHDLSLKELYSRIHANEITPFDASVLNAGYLYVKNPSLDGPRKEGDTQGYYQTSATVFDVMHDRGYPLQIRLQVKQVNDKLIDNIALVAKKKPAVKGMFGRLTLERGKFVLYPLSCIDENRIWFPCLSMDMKLTNKDLLQNLYKQTKP